MAKRTWRFQLEDRVHVVELEHGSRLGKRTIYIDGKVIEQRAKLGDMESEYSFILKGHACVIRRKSNGLTYTYDLEIDGHPIEHGQQLNPPLVPSLQGPAPEEEPESNDAGDKWDKSEMWSEPARREVRRVQTGAPYAQESGGDTGDTSVKRDTWGKTSQRRDPKAEARARYEVETVRLAAQARSGANWFYFIAGTSLINTIIILFGGSISLLLGLGTTQLIDGFAIGFSQQTELGDTAKYIGVVLDVCVAGLFALFGWLSRNRAIWAFIVGMVLYLLDGLLMVWAEGWLSIAMHALALFYLFVGLRATIKLQDMERAQTPMQYGLY